MSYSYGIFAEVTERKNASKRVPRIRQQAFDVQDWAAMSAMNRVLAWAAINGELLETSTNDVVCT